MTTNPLPLPRLGSKGGSYWRGLCEMTEEEQITHYFQEYERVVKAASDFYESTPRPDSLLDDEDLFAVSELLDQAMAILKDRKGR